MATPARVAKRTQRQVQVIMEAVNKVTAEIAELKTVSEPVELAAEFADSSILDEIRLQAISIGVSISLMADELVRIAAIQEANATIINKMATDIAELKPKRRGRKPSTD